MKALYKKILPYILSLEILFMSFFSCSITVRASDFVARDIIEAVEYGIEFNDWNPFWDFLYSSGDGLVYMLSQMGAFVTKDFVKWVNNNRALESLVETVPAKKEENNIVFTVEFMTQLKTLLDDYAAENQPFILEPTFKLSEIPASTFTYKVEYDNFKSYFEGDSYKYIYFQSRFSPRNFVEDITPIIKEGGGFVKYTSNNRLIGYMIYDSQWCNYKPVVDCYTVKIDESGDPFIEYTGETMQPFCIARTDDTPSSGYNLATIDGGRIRVYNTVSDFINYSVGQRKVYYTTNYYNYVPEDLSVSIDELQKTIEDMQDVIDKLLGQITNDTSESEIEELLRQILEEMKNNQGGNSGGDGSGGSSGGDVNVDIDLGSTNGLLSKILAKVTQIFDKISQTAENAGDTFHAKLQETLDEILVQIKKLKHWTMADTAVNAADAVADWLDFIKDLFSGADDAAESAVGAISSVMDDGANLMKTKFPFCIPWDVYLLVGFLAEEPQTPHFRLPIVLERYGIEEYIEVDLENFTVISRLSRTLLTCMYCYALLNLTMKVFPITKEGGD